MNLVCLMVERMVMQMVRVLGVGLVQTKEKHWGQMTEMKSEHLKEKLKERGSVYSSAELTEIEMVLTTETCWVELMEMLWVHLMEMSLAHLKEKPKDWHSVCL